MFYADGADKSGNWLMTSYSKREQAARYRAGATIFEGERFLDLDLGVCDDGPYRLRTLMTRASDAEVNEGNFVIYVRNGPDESFRKAGFSYPTYALANTAVKGVLINLYYEVAVVET